jgi:hypothetical protein
MVPEQFALTREPKGFWGTRLIWGRVDPPSRLQMSLVPQGDKNGDGIWSLSLMKILVEHTLDKYPFSVVLTKKPYLLHSMTQ